MLTILRKIRTPLTSLILFNLGAAFLVTLLSLRLKAWGVPPWEQGLSGACYYIGYALGAFLSVGLIRRVGHVRAYSTLAPVLIVVALLHGLLPTPWVWHILRIISGYCVAGTLLCIESWLLLLATARTRGRVLALYTIALYFAQGSGQFLRSLDIDFSNIMAALSIVSILAALSIIPIAATRLGASPLQETQILPFRELFKISPIGVLGCLISGLILGVLYTLLPVSILELGYSEEHTYWGMGLLILGGGFLQYPLGRLSDLADRRKLILSVGILSTLASLSLILPIHSNMLLFFGLLFLLGGACFAIYPLCISYACDFVKEEDSLCAAGGLFLAYSLGAIAGPYVSSLSTGWMGPQGRFIYLAVMSGLLVVVAIKGAGKGGRASGGQEQVPGPGN